MERLEQLKKVVITGGTGLIGTGVAQSLVSFGCRVIVLSRRANIHSSNPLVSYHQWDARTVGDWAKQLEGADGVLNIAGESIGARRWTDRQKEKIVRSRLDATSAIVRALSQAVEKPGVLVNGSAVGFYGDTGDEVVLEDHAAGQGFLSETTAAWEIEGQRAKAEGIRVALFRTGVVLDRNAEALKRIMFPFRLCVGGPLGSGRQWFPWIHLEDAVRAIVRAIQAPSFSGPYNLTAPEAVTMAGFCKILGEVMHKPSWLPVPSLALKAILGEMSGLILTGQRVLPGRLTRAGFEFRFPALRGALTDVVSRA